jgi:hypothetical protein
MFRRALLRELQAAAIGPYVDSVINGIKVTEVNVDSPRSRAKIQGNKLLVQWGADSRLMTGLRDKYLPKWVKWAERQLGKKQDRIQERKEWARTSIDGYSVYDVEGKEQVAAILGKVQRDVQPILRQFNLRFQTMKESVAEGTLGFNRGRHTIALNVRQKANPMKLRKYSAVMRTMIHEIAHLRHMNHNLQFQMFDEELLAWARANGIYVP